MKKYLSVAAVAALVSGLDSAPAHADGKDVFLGAVLGAIASEAVRSNRQSNQQTTRRVVRQQAPSLNSQFSRAERVEIQSALANQGYAIGTIDGILGQNSRRVIGQWQASRGEAQTGQLTRAQYVALVSGAAGAPVTFAARPLNRNEVVLLQEGLQRLGYYRGGIDGQQGPGTRGGTTAFLASQGFSQGQLTPVQTLVLARQAAGLGSPTYLQTEASGQMAASPFGAPQQQSPFGAAPTQQATFGAAPQTGFGAPQQGFGAPQGGQQALFGAPQQQQGTFGAVPQQGQQAVFGAVPQQGGFGTPQQGQQATFGTVPQQGGFGAQQQSGQQPVFGAAPPAQTQQGTFGVPQGQQAGTFGTGQPPVQQTFGVAPQAQGNQFAPQGGQLNAQPPMQQQAPASTLDIFSGSGAGQQPAPAAPAPAVPQSTAPQILVGGQAGAGVQQPVFGAPAAGGVPAQPTGQMLFAPPSN
ncbi:MAG: peptidoglycan-binding domain-containing protein [Pseudomonadota bacterium]